MATSLSPERIRAGYATSVAGVRARVLTFARAAWTVQGSYRDADVARLVDLIVPRVQAGQVQVAQLTSAYIAAVASAKTGRVVPAVAVDTAVILGGRGTPAVEVYQRPAKALYRALAEGVPFPAAVARGVSRLESLVATDMQMAKVRQSSASMKGSGFTFYRRVLNGAGNCALCTIASTQRYRVGTLMPIHPGCDCGVEQIDAGQRVSQTIDPAALEAAHQNVGELTGVIDNGGRAVDYRKLIIARDHGEIGPLLTWRRDHFTGPADL